jgi:phosphoserine phosphatase RsbU/P
VIQDVGAVRVEASGKGATAPRKVLIVDDSRAQRRVLSLALRRFGYHVSEAESGFEALALCEAQAFDIVLSDWMMPGMTGLEFCRAFRALPDKPYGYFILLTSKSEKAEVADGLDGGADDFLSKPVSTDELGARLRAGERILGMQAELVQKNALIGETLAELRLVYETLDRDLIEARKLQDTLVRDRHRDFGAAQVTALLRPSGRVGGDLVGFFEIAPGRIGLYAVDVSGHGVASAMMTARLAGHLSASSPSHNIAMKRRAEGGYAALRPAQVAQRLNQMMFDVLQVDHYFTMAYAEVDLKTGQVCLVQAGHPHPVHLSATGAVSFLGEGGMPIGLIESAAYETFDLQLSPGDRLFLVSDGVTECPDKTGEEFGEEGLRDFLQDNAKMQNEPLLEALIWRLAEHCGHENFPDDISGVLLRFNGA